MVCVHCPVEALVIIWKHWKKSSGTAEKPYREEAGVDERVQNLFGLSQKSRLQAGADLP